MREVTDRDIKEFQAGFCPFGTRDITTAIETYLEADRSEVLKWYYNQPEQ